MTLRAQAWAAALALAALAALPYLLINDEPDALDDAARANAPGRFALLSSGRTHYEVRGPADAPTVVLVHGTSTPLFVWDHNVDALAAAGLRVVRYDLFGRGLSDRPDARYDLDFHVTQLEELLAQLAPGRAVDLAGLSMGGIFVAEFARRHPDRVRKLALVAPAGVGTQLPPVARLASAPGVGEYLMRVAGTRLLRPGPRSLLHPERHPEFEPAFYRTLRFAGSRRAVLRSIRHVPLNDYAEGYRALGALGKPILLVWGRRDAVVPFAASDPVRELVRPAAFVAVDEAAHLPHYERPEVVNPALTSFLARS